MFNVDFQRSVLKLLCTNLQFATVHGPKIKEEFLDTQPLRIIFSLSLTYVYTYEKELDLPELHVLIDEYIQRKGFSFETLNMLREESKTIFRTHVKSEQFIVDQLIKFCRRQALKEALICSIDILEKDGNPEQILKMIDQAVSIGSEGTDMLTYSDLLILPEKYKTKYNPEKMVRSGMHKYDKALLGGWAPGEVHQFLGGAKSGKTTVGCNIGTYGLITNKAVFHISLEIKSIDIMAKYATRMTGLSYTDIITMDKKIYEEKISKFNQFKPKLFVNYWTEQTINALTIRGWISGIRAQHNVTPDLIIVDYDELLRPVSGHKDDMYNDAGEIYSDLIALADYFKCPLITMAQTNREAWDLPNKGELVRAHHMAHSAKKAHKCYSVTSINFAEGSPTGLMYIDMNRRGDSGVKIPIERDFNRGLIAERND